MSNLELLARRRTWIDVIAVVCLAALLRLTTLGLQGYEVDEGATVFVLRDSLVQTMRAVAHYESTPPLYYALAWAWSKAFGTHEAALRLLSALAGIATVPVVYALGRTLATRRVGLVAAAIAATSPYLVFYSQEARAYALYTLLSTVALLFCVRAIRTPVGREIALWAAVSVAAVATHYFALFLFAGQAVALAVFGVPRRLVAYGAAATVVLSIPALLLARDQADTRSSWIGAISIMQRVRVAAETLSLGATFRGSLSHAVLLGFGLLAVVIAGAVTVALVLLFKRADADERRAARMLGLIGAVALAVPLLGSVGFADYFINKNMIPLIPIVAVILAAGLGCRRAGLLGATGAVALVLAGAALTLMSFSVPSLERPDVRLVSKQLGAPARDRVVMFVPRWRALLEHYQGPLLDLPTGGRPVTELDVFAQGSFPSEIVPQDFKLARVQKGDSFTVWTFRSARPSVVRPGVLAGRTFSESGLQPIAVLQARG